MKKKTRQDFQELLKTEHGKKGCTVNWLNLIMGLELVTECGKVADDGNPLLRIIQTNGKVSKWAGNKSLLTNKLVFSSIYG